MRCEKQTDNHMGVVIGSPMNDIFDEFIDNQHALLERQSIEGYFGVEGVELIP